MLSTHLAIDLGASSGRAVLGLLEGDPPTLRAEETHRFEHAPLETPAGPVWDLTAIAAEVFEGIRRGAQQSLDWGLPLTSVGVDSWGVDWTILTPGGELLGLPHCYRDPAHREAKARVLSRLAGGATRLFQRTGIQPHFFNTLFQLDARLTKNPELAPSGSRLALLPDLFHYWLTGAPSNERSMASTTSLAQFGSGDWDLELVDELGLPTGILGPITEPATPLGRLRPELAAWLGVSEEIEVVAPASHDTASAVAAAPAAGREPATWAFLSSGTWSILGAELREPITTERALAAGFSNELGTLRSGRPTVHFCRNISGMWLVQELQRDLARSGVSLGFEELARLAAEAAPLRTLVDPDAADLASPGGSIGKLRGHALRTGQPAPETPGQLTRCCLDSLACAYASSMDELEAIVGRPLGALHAFGGGVKNRLLNQITADAIDRPVLAGPIEATALGNLLVQAMGLGRLATLDDVRAVVARSEPIETFSPSASRAPEVWAEARRRYARCAEHSL